MGHWSSGACFVERRNGSPRIYYFIAKAAASIKEEFSKAVEAKKELAKPVQFSAVVTKGSAADIQDRFRYRVSEAGQQQTKLQEEGNRILNSLDQGMKKLISKSSSTPIAKIT